MRYPGGFSGRVLPGDVTDGYDLGTAYQRPGDYHLCWMHGENVAGHPYLDFSTNESFAVFNVEVAVLELAGPIIPPHQEHVCNYGRPSPRDPCRYHTMVEGGGATSDSAAPAAETSVQTDTSAHFNTFC